MCVCVEAWRRAFGLSLELFTAKCGAILLGDFRQSKDKDLNIVKSRYEKVIYFSVLLLLSDWVKKKGNSF